MENGNNECGSCHPEKMPWWSCILLAGWSATYHAVGDNLLKSPETGDKVAGIMAKGLGKVIDSTFEFYCK